MPVKIIEGYPSKHCDCGLTENNVYYEYWWVHFGVVLVEKITNYICKSCGGISTQVLEHREEKAFRKGKER